MQGEYLTMENAEKLANYERLEKKLEETKAKTEYWKNEHFQLSLKNKELRKNIKKLTEENDSLKEIISKVNRGNNEKFR